MKKLFPIFTFASFVISAPIPSPAASPAVENVVVYHNPKEFAGWPANEGMWSWGNEMLAGFEVAKYNEVDKDHSVDRNSPKRILFSRSHDGGLTWKTEEHPEIEVPEYLGDPDRFKQNRPGSKQPVACPGGIDFSHPDFAMKMRGGTFYVSYSRGKSWEGPYILPEFGYSSEARTSYIVTGKESCLFFIVGRLKEHGVRYARSGVLETRDGGKSFQFLGWIGDEIGKQLAAGAQDKGDQAEEAGNENVFSIMPSAVRMDDGRYVCAVRQRIERNKWTDIFESTDGGASWRKLCTLEKGSSNPATLVKMEGEKMVAVYGNRRKKPLGLSAKVSRDGGKTWSDEVMLRSDARKWDLGYSRALLRPDGKVVTLYYYTTEEMPENFIAATIWAPEDGQPENGEIKP